MLREHPAGSARWPSTITHQPGAPRPSCRGWTPPGVLWSLLHVTQIPSDPATPAPPRPRWWSCHSPGTGDRRAARPLSVVRGHQGKSRPAEHSTSRSPLSGSPPSPPGWATRSRPPLNVLDTKQEPTYVREGGGGASREHGGQTGRWPCSLSALGAPAQAGPLSPQGPFVVWHFTHSRASPPSLPRQIPSVLPPRAAPLPCPRQRGWAPSRCHPGRSRQPRPESSSPLQRPCKSRFG